MGPWSAVKKSTNLSDDAVVQSEGPPRQSPGRPSRAPPAAGQGLSRSNPKTRPQDGVNREHEERRHQPRQVSAGSRGIGEGPLPEGRAVARSHGRPAQQKRTAARAPEASTSNYHVSHTPRQTGVFLPPSATPGRHPVSQNERIRTQSNNSDPRATGETMRNKRDNSPVKNIHNVRRNQGTMGSQARPSMGRGVGLQPEPVSARGGVPRPSRPPAPSQPHSEVGGRRLGPGPSQEHRPSSTIRDQHMTSASSDRNTPGTIMDDGTKPSASSQQMIINPTTTRLKVQNRPSQKNQSNPNTAGNSTSSKVHNPSRTSYTANNDQSRLPNNQSSRTEARPVPVLQGTSRQIVQKVGNNNNTNRNISSDVHSNRRTNTEALAGTDINRLSSSSSSGNESNAKHSTSGNNAKHKQKNKTKKRDCGKPENVSNTRTMTVGVGVNPEIREGSVESSSSACGQRNEARSTVLPRGDNHSTTNSDNPTGRQVQRADGSGKNNNKPAGDSQVLRQKPTPPCVGLSSQPPREVQGQRSTSDQSGHSERTESTDRISDPTAVTKMPANLRNRSETSATSQRATGASESATTPTSRGSSEGRTANTPTEGPRERAGGSGQSNSSSTVPRTATNMDRERNIGDKQQSTTSGERSNNCSRDMVESAQRSNGHRNGLNEGSGLRSQRILAPQEGSGEAPSSNSTSRNGGRVTNGSQSQVQSASASSSSVAPNNTADSANNVVSHPRRPEVTGVNSGARTNTANSNNRTTMRNNSDNNRTTTAQNSTSSRASNTQNNNISNKRPSGTQNTSRPSGQTRAAVQGNSANTSGARVSNQNRSNMSTSATVQVIGSSGGGGSSQQQRQAQRSGAVLDPSQLNIDIIDNSVSVSDQPPPYSTLDVHSSGNRRNNRHNTNNPPNQALPDILNSLVHPPRQNESRSTRRGGGSTPRDGGPHRNQSRNAPLSTAHSGRRPPTQLRDGTTRLDSTTSWEGCACNKWCCLRCLTIITTFRWILITLALLGVCCVLTGIVLGALHMTIGSSFLTLSLMFIGKFYFIKL